MHSPTSNELNELLTYLTRPERAELEAILQATKTPWTIIHEIIRPDRSTESYLLATGYQELAADDPRIKDYPPATPEVNGGYRPSDWIEMGHKPQG